MKRLTFLSVVVLFSTSGFPQGVGIGIVNPHAKAALDISSTDKGLLVPRVTSVQRLNIMAEHAPPRAAADPIGLIVYDTDKAELMFYDNGTWQNVGVPRGTIVMWSGSTAPPGWRLCDGGENTPDLKGRFIVGYAAGTEDYGEPGNLSTTKFNEAAVKVAGLAAGLEETVLAVVHLPAHSHQITINSAGVHSHGYDYPDSKQVAANSGGGEGAADHDNYTNYPTSDSGEHTHTATVGNTGDNVAFENRPPYYVLAYIMKL